MSGPGSLPARHAYSFNLANRPASNLQNVAGPSQPQFGQTAPGYGRNVTTTTQPGYTSYTQYGAGQATRQGGDKEQNLLNELSPEQRDEISEAFNIFDLDRDHHLDFHETRVALRALGFNLPKSEIVQILTRHGVQKPSPGKPSAGPRQAIHVSQQLLPRHVFTGIAAEMVYHRDPAEEVERAFYLFDIDKKDFISLEDLRRVASELGESSLDEQELLTMVEEFDYDGNGRISKETFFSICLQ